MHSLEPIKTGVWSISLQEKIDVGHHWDFKG